MLQQHRWSSLPDDIIAKIISHLNFPRPRSPAIRISGTTFRVNYILHYSLRGTVNISELWKILDNLFTIFITPSIDTFIIFLDNTLYEEPCVRPILTSWTRRLGACNIQHITINSVYSRFIGDGFCPPSVFQIKSLVSLDLLCVTYVSHYPVIILPNLKKLSLGSVSHEFLGRLLNSCPSLEDLSFSLNYNPKGKIVSVTISSKTLKRLCMTVNIWLGNRDMEVIIDAPTLDHLIFNTNSHLLSMRMIGLISNLKSLELRDVSMTMIYSSPTNTIYPFVTKLILSVSSSKIFEQHMLPYYFPNLEILVLYCWFLNDIDWDIKGTFVLVEHVKHLELRMSDIRLNQRTLNLLSWLLRSAPILEKLFIFGYAIRSSNDSLDKDQFYENLLKCAEDTSRCEIVMTMME